MHFRGGPDLEVGAPPGGGPGRPFLAPGPPPGTPGEIGTFRDRAVRTGLSVPKAPKGQMRFAWISSICGAAALHRSGTRERRRRGRGARVQMCEVCLAHRML